MTKTLDNVSNIMDLTNNKSKYKFKSKSKKKKNYAFKEQW